MRDAALPLLACPTCHAPFRLQKDATDPDGHIMTGTLACTGCGARFPIHGGIPRLVPGSVAPDATETAARFGEQWKTFDHMSDYQEDWFKAWLAPIKPDDFAGKTVLEAGCGKGRHTITASGWGPKDLIALDLGEAVEVAFHHTRARTNVHVVQGDILHPPLARVFDLAFSIGVLHHLPDPRGGFQAVASKVKPGGRIAVWVYGYENNEWIVRWVNPLRERVTAKMPHKLLYWATLPPSAALGSFTRLYKNDALFQRLPYAPYMRKLADLPLREVHNIVYDQLVTPIAYYLPREEVQSWFDDRFSDVALTWHNENSWRATARVS